MPGLLRIAWRRGSNAMLDKCTNKLLVHLGKSGDTIVGVDIRCDVVENLVCVHADIIRCIQKSLVLL
jgi:hypothetical protein